MGTSQQADAGHRLRLVRLTRLVLGAVLLCAAGTAAGADGLAELIQSGERRLAIEAIAAGADVNAAQGDGTTPLHWAVYRVDRELVALLLEHGAKADVANRYGANPLGEAIKTADAKLVEMLLEAGVDPDSPNADGQTALMLAARSGSVEIATTLLRAGATIDAVEAWRGQTALMWAADSSAAGVVALLIEHGADIEARGAANDWEVQVTSEPRGQYRPTGGYTPLLYAARAGCSPCVTALLDAGAAIDRPNPDGMTALILAIDNQRFETVALLLDRGANPNIWDWWHRTPLYVAIDVGAAATRTPHAQGELSSLDIARRLLEAGVDPNAQLNMHRPGRGGNIGRFVDDLLTTGATPLLRAAVSADVEALRLLLGHGALVDLPNVMGVTPLMAAAGMGVSSRDRAANVGDGAEANSILALDVLLAAGADIDARVTDIDSRSARIARASTMTERLGQTALYGAIKFARPMAVQFLIDRGADVDIVDALGKTPLDAALGRTGGRDNTVSEEVAAILRAAGAR